MGLLMANKRIAGLDGIRAIGILLVLMTHGMGPHWAGAAAGVDIFFALSGWLIAGLLVEKGHLAASVFKAFYQNRLVRLYPALLTVVAVVTAAAWFTTINFTKALAEATASVLYAYPVYSYWFPKILWGHMWTLSMEWYFYLVFPPMLYLAARWNRKRAFRSLLLVVWCLTSAVVIASSIAHNGQLGAESLLRVSAIALGAWLRLRPQALDKVSNPTPRLTLVATAAFLALLVASTLYPVLIGPTYIAAGILGLVYIRAVYSEEQTFVRKALDSREMVWIGSISYEIYLWHFPLLILANSVIGPVNGLKTLVVYAVSLVLAHLTHRIWLAPQRALRRKISKGLTSAPPSE